MKLQRGHGKPRPAAIAAMATLALAGCGGGAKPRSAARTTPVSRITSVSSVGVGLAAIRISASLSAPDHRPVVGKGWPYSVRVTDRSGHPLSGSVRIQFVFGGHVVATDTPPVHPLTNGRWRERLRFPNATLGLPLDFQVVVRTSAGSVTLNWPVTPKP